MSCIRSQSKARRNGHEELSSPNLFCAAHGTGKNKSTQNFDNQHKVPIPPQWLVQSPEEDEEIVMDSGISESRDN